MEEYSYFDEDPKKGWGFVLAFAALMLFTIMGLGIDVDEYLQHEYLDIPRWYFYIIFSIDALMMIGLVLMFFYKKSGFLCFRHFWYCISLCTIITCLHSCIRMLPIFSCSQVSGCWRSFQNGSFSDRNLPYTGSFQLLQMIIVDCFLF